MDKLGKRLLAVILALGLLVGGLGILGAVSATAAFNTIPMIAAGADYSLALKSDGTVWSWGWNSVGQLGDNTTANRHAPVQVLNLKDITAISAGYNHSLALKSDGTVWAWGGNTSCQLGDNTITNRSTPVLVQNLNNVIAIAAGANYSLALKNDGTVWGWGYNDQGQLGDNSQSTRSTPVQVRDLSGITAIEADVFHSLALKNNGTVWGWGWNINGQLAENPLTIHRVPVQVLNLNSITAIAIGYAYSLALKNDGTVWGCGGNDTGQLGDNTTINRLAPVQVQNLNSATTIVAGQYHSLALKSDHTVWGWGSNGYGQLGDNTTTNRYSPIQIATLNNIISVATNRTHSLALKSDGTVWAWGKNLVGTLGDNTTTNRLLPVQVKGPNGVGGFNVYENSTQPTTYTITYNANGGTGAPPADTKTQGVALTLSSTKPTRTGYAFKGWANSKTATTAQWQPGGSYTIDGNATLWAVWEAVPNGQRVNFDTDRWSFGNQTTTITEDHYKHIFGAERGAELYVNGTKGDGQCFGMASTTAAILFNSPAVSTFGRNNLVDVLLRDKSSDLHVPAVDFIKYANIMQHEDDIAQQYNNNLVNNKTNNLGDLSNIYDFVSNNSSPIIILIWGDYNGDENQGHAVFPMWIENETSAGCDIVVNDSNHPAQKRIITLTRTNNQFSGWSYQLFDDTLWGNEQPNSNISFIKPVSHVYSAVKKYGDIKMLLQTPISSSNSLLLTTNTADFTLSAEGKTIAGSNADNDVLIKMTPKIGVVKGGKSNTPTEKKLQFWVRTDETVSFADLEKDSQLNLLGNNEGVRVEIPSGSTAHINVAQSKANLTVPKNGAVKVTHETAAADGTINTISASGQSAGQIQSALVGQIFTISGLHGTVQLESKINGITDKKTVTGVKEGETVYASIQNNKIVIEVKETPVTPPGDFFTITNAPTAPLQYRKSITLSASEAVTWSSDSKAVKVDPVTGKVESVRSFSKINMNARITATSLDSQRTTSIDIQIKLAWWQWLIVIPLFGWIWY